MNISDTKTKPARPFLKWVGGKRQLLDAIEQRLPAEIQETGVIRRYVEPFVGGGAAYFYLQAHYDIGEAFLCDINRELILGYQVIRNNVSDLIGELRAIEEEYLSLDELKREEYYYRVRDKYNEQMGHIDFDRYNPAWITRAAQMIFMNKTCYNGLFRQNQQGEFNVPFGRYDNPTICDEENLNAVHLALQNAKILCRDFRETEDLITEDTFVYFDPPYRPLNSTANFTSYFKGDFADNDQRELAGFFHRMSERGAKLLLSNSDPSNEDPDDSFFQDLYAGASVSIEQISATRNVNRNSAGRGEISELIIRNY